MKKLRYGVEAFAVLWPAKRRRAFEQALGKLQASLGRANDAATAARLLASLEAPKALAAVAEAWIADEMATSTGKLPGQLAALENAPRFWK